MSRSHDRALTPSGTAAGNSAGEVPTELGVVVAGAPGSGHLSAIARDVAAHAAAEIFTQIFDTDDGCTEDEAARIIARHAGPIVWRLERALDDVAALQRELAVVEQLDAFTAQLARACAQQARTHE